MKQKPDVSSFQRPELLKDPSDFLEGATADKADKSAMATTVERHSEGKPKAEKPKTQKQLTVQKIFRHPSDLAMSLKMHATEQSVSNGRRVTEQEIVEKLLRLYLKI